MKSKRRSPVACLLLVLLLTPIAFLWVNSLSSDDDSILAANPPLTFMFSEGDFVIVFNTKKLNYEPRRIPIPRWLFNSPPQKNPSSTGIQQFIQSNP